MPPVGCTVWPPRSNFHVFTLSDSTHFRFRSLFAIKKLSGLTTKQLSSRETSWKLTLRFSMTPVKRTIWPLRAIFDTFACFFHSSRPNRSPFFGTYSQNWGKISTRISKIVRKILLRFSDPPEKRTVWARQTVFGTFADLRDVRGVKTPLAAFQSKSSLHTKFAQYVQLHCQQF